MADSSVTDAVLEFLRTNKFSKAEAALRRDLGSSNRNASDVGKNDGNAEAVNNIGAEVKEVLPRLPLVRLENVCLNIHREEKHEGDASSPKILTSDNDHLVGSASDVAARFSLAEIQLATEDFSDARLIGKGGFRKFEAPTCDSSALVVILY